uniref:Protease Do-like 14 n=2 Tax=Caenorhabditis tropicalis TaxID=1561998 RepID=A0A1I7T0D5_9PELO
MFELLQRMLFSEIDDRVHKLAQYLFCEKSDTKACFTVISTHHAASFYHGPHKHWDPKSTGNHTMTICNQAGQEFQTKIVACNPEVDFVIVSSDVPFVTVAPRLCLPNKSERYILLGYPKPNTGYEALEGIITSVLLDDEGRLRGSRGSQRGYNGGPMFNYKGELLGINVADKSSQQCIGLSNRSTLEKPFSEINDAFPSLSVMVPSCILASSSF